MSVSLSLFIASMIWAPPAGAHTDPAAAALRSYIAAANIPAFARKYGMKCSACHLAVPVLNQFGQAFKDNGYRMKNGTDDLRANEPAYWPLIGRLGDNFGPHVQRRPPQNSPEQRGPANYGFALGA